MRLFPDLAIDVPGYPAVWSNCLSYRYTLWRTWTNNPRPHYAMFCCLNPSTATEFEDDPTVRRCIGYAKAWGFDAFVMANLFAYRATDPRNMKAAADPIGPENDEWLAKLAAGAGLIVAGWGAHGEFMGRAAQVRRLLPDLHYLKLTKGGQPSHPLYLRADLQPQRWGLGSLINLISAQSPSKSSALADRARHIDRSVFAEGSRRSCSIACQASQPRPAARAAAALLSFLRPRAARMRAPIVSAAWVDFFFGDIRRHVL